MTIGIDSILLILLWFFLLLELALICKHCSKYYSQWDKPVQEKIHTIFSTIIVILTIANIVELIVEIIKK